MKGGMASGKKQSDMLRWYVFQKKKEARGKGRIVRVKRLVPVDKVNVPALSLRSLVEVMTA